MSLKWNVHQNGIRDKNYGFKRDDFDQPNYEGKFHAIYFIDNITGAVLVSSRYTNNMTETNEDLISSFLNAMDMFIKEIKEGNEQIQEINFSDTRILYERKGRLTCVAITGKSSLKMERAIVQEVFSDFYCRFESEINRFRGIIHPSILDYKNRLENLNLNTFHK